MHPVRGFTLVELVVILIVLGILAVFAMPRFAGREPFDARAFHDSTLAALRYAQKTAIAQRRPVCVSFSANSLTLSIAENFAGDCDTPLYRPDKPEQSYTLTAAAQAAFSPVPKNFSFQPSGDASARQEIRVQDRPLPIIVEALGYVH